LYRQKTRKYLKYLAFFMDVLVLKTEGESIIIARGKLEQNIGGYFCFWQQTLFTSNRCSVTIQSPFKKSETRRRRDLYADQ